MKTLRVCVSGLLILLWLLSCAPPPAPAPFSPPKRNLFVIMPDPDGKTGQIAVTNQAGTQIVDKPGQATEVRDAKTAPEPPRPMDEKEIARLFGAALAAQPAPPVTYILYFKSGGADLTEESLKKLPAIFATVAERKSSDITVVGHSDTVGAKQKNYEISLNRAKRIKELLVSKGVDSGKIATESHGEDNPLVKTADEVAEPRNRRVEVTIR